jgi:hypothetical protein
MDTELCQYLADQLPITTLAHKYRKTLMAIQMKKVHHTPVPEREQNRLSGMPYAALELLLHMHWP